MRVIMKSVTVIGQEALKLVKAGYDSGMSWSAVAKQMGIRFLLEQQRAELYASANAALYDKLTALQSDPSDSAAARSFRLTQDQLRPGDPRRDFPGGVPHTVNSSAARTGRTSSETPSVSNTPKESAPIALLSGKDGLWTNPAARAAQDQAGRRTEPTLDADWPGTIAD